MEETKKALEDFFEEMLGNIRYFKKRSYEEFFKNAYARHKELIVSLETLDEVETIDELAAVIPEYAKKRFQEIPKNKRDKAGIDYNLTMAVYVVPMLLYRHDAQTEELVERMVKMWNENQVTGYTLQRSEYEQIAGGFKNRPCYITTAVCESQGKEDDCYELTLLRRYRDEYMMQTEEGRARVDEYYDLAPGIVFSVGMHKDSDSIYERIRREYLLPCIRHIENGENEACDKLYGKMVYDLKERYMPEYL